MLPLGLAAYSRFGFSKFCLSLRGVGDSARLNTCSHFVFSKFRTKFQGVDG